jgi:DNA repair protein RecO (recombination protein O)
VVILYVLHARSFCVGRSGHASRHSVGAPTLRMPARETEAIILKTFPLGEADRLVSFLGRSSGRMRGVASGARRLKNRYGSTLELLSHVQIWYVERETRDLVRIQQADLLDSREVERRGATALALAYFAFWTVRLAGWLPRFDLCAACAKPFGNSSAFQDTFHPGLYDAEHRRSGMKPVSAEARDLAEVFAKQGLVQLDEGLSALPGVKELREAALNWIEHHTERRMKTRTLLETA